MAHRKHILSPQAVRARDRLERGRATQREQLRSEAQRLGSYFAPDGGVDIRKPEAQFGRSLSRAEVMRRMQRLNSNLKYEFTAINPFVADPFTGGELRQGQIYMAVLNPESGRTQKLFLCGIPHDQVAEFHIPYGQEDEIPDPDNENVRRKVLRLKGYIPGWRSILLTLLKKGLLSPAGIDREFHIIEGRSSQRWQQAVN